MPQSTIRRLLIDLEEEGVLESSDIGQAKPYSVSKIGYALDRGYVSFTKEEVQEILKPREAIEGEFSYFVITGGVSDERDGTRITRYLTPGGERMARSLMARLSGYLPQDPASKMVDVAFDEEEKKGLRFMFPEMYLFSKMFRSSQESFWPVFPVSMEAGGFTPEQARELIQESFEEQIVKGRDLLERIARMLEEGGYRDLLHREPLHRSDYMEAGKEYPIEYRFRKEYIYTATYLMRQGLLIGEKIGLKQNELDQVRALCDALDSAMEKEHKGIDKERPIVS